MPVVGASLTLLFLYQILMLVVASCKTTVLSIVLSAFQFLI